MEKDGLEALNEMWSEQVDFNGNFFTPASSVSEQSRQTKEFILHLHSELDELLRSTVWKVHRQVGQKPNPAQIRNELTDILKYWISLCIVWGVSPEEAVKDFWRKSMVCRQRYSEEFVTNLNRPSAIFDIDHVLCKYADGLLSCGRFVGGAGPTGRGCPQGG